MDTSGYKDVIYITNVITLRKANTYINLKSLKGNEALEIFFLFFSKARKYGEEIKIKKKLKFLYFRPHKRLFESEERELNGGERSVF